MKGKNHIVKKQRFNIEINSAKNAKAAQDEVSRICRFKLAPVLDRLLSKYNPSGETIRLDQLVLNCQYANLEELESKLIDALEKQLLGLLQERDEGIRALKSQDQSTSSNHSTIQLLEYFLLKGAFPWWADSRIQNISVLVEKLLEEQTNALWILLEKESKNGIAIRRFCWQINAKLLKKIKERLLKQQYQKANRYHKKITAFFQQECNGLVSRSLLTSIFQQHFLSYAIRYREQRFDEQDYLAYSVEALLQHEKIDSEKLVDLLLKNKKNKHGKKTFARFLKKEMPSMLRKSKRGERTRKRNWSELERLLFFVEKGYYPDDKAISSEMLNEMVLNIFEQGSGVGWKKMKEILSDAVYLKRLTHHLTMESLSYLNTKMTAGITPKVTAHRQELKTVFSKIFQGIYSEESIANKIEQALFFFCMSQQKDPPQLIDLLEFVLKAMAQQTNRRYSDLLQKGIEEMNENKSVLRTYFVTLSEAPQLEGEEYSVLPMAKPLLNFLTKGKWNKVEQDQSIDDLEVDFLQLLESGDLGFKKNLLEQLKNSAVRKRLLESFSVETIQKVRRLILKEEEQKVLDFYHDFQEIFHQLYPSLYTRKKMQTQLDNISLSYFVNRGSGSFQTVDFLQVVLSNLAVFFNQSYSQLIQEVQGLLWKKRQKKKFKTSLPQLIQELVATNEDGLPRTSSDEINKPLKSFKHFLLKGVLLKDTRIKSLVDLEFQLLALIESKHPQLIALFKELFQQPENVNLFFKRFSQKVIDKISNQIIGPEREKAKNYISDIYGLVEYALVGPYAKNQLDQLLEKGIFIFLVKENNQLFNPIFFLKEIVTFLANALNLSFEQILDTLSDKAKTIDEKKQFSSPLPDLLKQLLPANQEESKRENQTEILTAVQLLNQFLEEGVLPPHAQIKTVADLETLALRLMADDPVKLKTLLKKLLKKRSRLLFLVQHFSSKTIEQMGGLVAGSERETVKNYLIDLRKIMAAVFVGIHSKKFLNSQIDAAYLTYITKVERSIFNPLLFLREMFGFLGDALNVTTEELSDKIEQKAKRIEREIRFNSPLSDLLKQHVSSNEPMKKTAKSAIQHPATELVLHFLKEGVLLVDKVVQTHQQLEIAFLHLIDEAPPPFEDHLLEVLSQPDSLDRLIHQFSNNLKNKLTHRLNTGANDWMNRYQTKLTTLLVLTKGLKYPEPFIREQVQLTALEFHVAYRNKNSQSEDFVRVFFKALAQKMNVDFQTLIQDVQATIVDPKNSNAFYQPLVRALEKLTFSVQENSNSSAELLAPAQQILHFVQSGRLNQKGTIRSLPELEKQLILLLEEKEKDFKIKLFEQLKTPIYIDSFVRQISLKTVRKINELIWDNYNLVEKYRTDIQNILIHFPERIAPRQALPKQIEKAIIVYRLRRQGEIFKPIQFVKNVFQQLAIHYHFPLLELIQVSAEKAQALDLKQAFLSPLPHFLKELAKTISKQKKPKQKEVPLVKILQHFFESGQLLPQQPTRTLMDLETRLVAACRQEETGFWKGFYRVLKENPHSQKRIRVFSVETLSLISQSLSQRFAKEVNETLRDLKLVFHQITAQKLSRENVDFLLEETILEALIESNQNGLKVEKVIEQSFQKIAKAQQISTEAIEMAFVETTEALETEKQLHPQLWKHLRSLQLKQKIKKEEPKEEPLAIVENPEEPQAPFVQEELLEAISPYSEEATFLLDQFRFWLKEGTFPWWAKEATDLTDLIHTLTKNHSELFLVVFKEVVVEEQFFQRVWSQISEASFQDLLQVSFGASAKWVWLFTDTVLSCRNHKKNKAAKKEEIFIWQMVFQEAFYTPFDKRRFLSSIFIPLSHYWKKSIKHCILKFKKQLLKSEIDNGKYKKQLLKGLDHLLQDQDYLSTKSKKTLRKRTKLRIDHRRRLANGANKRNVSEAFKMVQYFFTYGSLPVEGQFYSAKTFEQELIRLITKFPLPARSLFEKLFRMPIAVERALEYGSKKWDELFVELFYPTQATWMLTQHNALLTHVIGGKKKKKKQTTVLQIHLLQFLARHYKNPFNLEQYVMSASQRIAATERINTMDVIDSLQQKFDQSTQNIPIDLVNCVQEIQKRSTSETKVANPWQAMEDKAIQLDEAVYIHNAGLVILAPFLPQYFKMLDMMEDRKFKDEATAERAVHLLQYLVSGRTETAEHLLVFNKIFCGLPINTPVPLSIELTAEEEKISGEMMNAIMQNWDKMGKNTLEGFRGGFLIREGKITEEEEFWDLDVSPKAYDVLLQTLPWSISIVNHPWLNKRIQVKWI